VLARDRFGEKPLYYAVTGGRLTFASEIDALARHADLSLDLDMEAIELYLTFGWIPAPWSIYRSIRKLPHASWLEAGAAGVVGGVQRTTASRRGWAARPGHPARAVRATRAGGAPPARADVRWVPPSGGIDSSVVTFMAAGLPSRRGLFGTVPGDPHHDEGPMARRLADEIGTRHVEVPIDAAALLSEVPAALAAFGEPFADSSAIPCSVLARAARRGLTVALSGDGGDEIFGGYRSFRALAASRRRRHHRRPGRAAVGAAVPAAVAPRRWFLPRCARGKTIEGCRRIWTTHAAWLSMLLPGLTGPASGAIDGDLGRTPVEERHRRFGGGLNGAMAGRWTCRHDDAAVACCTSMRHTLASARPFLGLDLVEMALSLLASRTSRHATAAAAAPGAAGVVPDRVSISARLEVPVGDVAARWRNRSRPRTGASRGNRRSDGAVVEPWYRDHRGASRPRQLSGPVRPLPLASAPATAAGSVADGAPVVKVVGGGWRRILIRHPASHPHRPPGLPRRLTMRASFLFADPPCSSPAVPGSSAAPARSRAPSVVNFRRPGGQGPGQHRDRVTPPRILDELVAAGRPTETGRLSMAAVRRTDSPRWSSAWGHRPVAGRCAAARSA
jgi:hypothetical protein